MARDPAFLYYDGDAARDMAHMSRLERGCYIDIVHAQKKRDFLTLDDIKKVLGQDFTVCWPSVEWVMNREGDYYYIEWLRESLRKRERFSESRRQNRKKGVANISSSCDEDISESIKVIKSVGSEIPAIIPLFHPGDEHINNISSSLGDTSVKHVENENENKNEHVIENFEKGAGKTFEPFGIVPDFVRIFRDTFAGYAFDQQIDFPACMTLANRIGGWMGIRPDDIVGAKMIDVKLRWGEIVDFISTDTWFSTRSLSDLATSKEFQRLIQSFQKDRKNGTHIQDNRTGTLPGKVVGL